MKRICFLSFILVMLSSCRQAPQDRIINFESIENGRELGGLVMQDGRSIRYGCLVRSGNLSMASDADVEMLKKRFGLSDIFDFRFDAEAEGAPDRRIEGVRNTHLSTLPKAFIDKFSSGRADTARIKAADYLETLAKYAFVPEAQQLATQLYPAIVTNTISQHRYGEFLHGVLDAEGGVLWHCSQGKDRAGLGTAFVLAALGASRETIVQDFSLSNRYYAPVVETLSNRIKEMGGGQEQLNFINVMIGVSVENFESTLDMIDAQYGSLPSYLDKALGFSMKEQEKLKEKYLTE